MTTPDYQLGPPRAAIGFPWRTHRTGGEWHAGIEPADVNRHRAEVIRLAKYMKATGKSDGNAA